MSWTECLILSFVIAVGCLLILVFIYLYLNQFEDTKWINGKPEDTNNVSGGPQQ